MSLAFTATLTCEEQQALVLRDGGEWVLPVDFCAGRYDVLGPVDREGSRCWAIHEHTSETALGRGWGHRHVKVYCADGSTMVERASRSVEHSSTSVGYAMEAQATGKPQQVDVAYSDEVSFSRGEVRVERELWRWWELPGASVERHEGAFAVRQGWTQYTFREGHAPTWKALELVQAMEGRQLCWLTLATEPDGMRAAAVLCGRLRQLSVRSYRVLEPDSVVEANGDEVRIDGEPWAWSSGLNAHLKQLGATCSLVASGRPFPLPQSQACETTELLGSAEARGTYGCWLLRHRAEDSLEVVCPEDGAAMVVASLPVAAGATVGPGNPIRIDKAVWPWDGRDLAPYEEPAPGVTNKRKPRIAVAVPAPTPSIPEAQVELVMPSPGLLQCGEDRYRFLGERTISIEGHKLPAACLVLIEGASAPVQIRGSGSVSCSHADGLVRCEPELVGIVP